MSKAFTKESDADGETDLPEREISPFLNLVTPIGLAAIERELERHSEAHTRALSTGDRLAAARAARELRYWSQRRLTAQVAPAPANDDQVHFGSTVTIERADGRTQTFRIVGEDEADPAKGTLSHASPLARALMRREVGDTVGEGPTEAEIIAIVTGDAD